MALKYLRILKLKYLRILKLKYLRILKLKYLRILKLKYLRILKLKYLRILKLKCCLQVCSQLRSSGQSRERVGVLLLSEQMHLLLSDPSAMLYKWFMQVILLPARKYQSKLT